MQERAKSEHVVALCMWAESELVGAKSGCACAKSEWDCASKVQACEKIEQLGAKRVRAGTKSM